MKNIALVGLGPHAKRIYLNYMKKHKANLCLLIELESNKEAVKEYLNENGFKRTKIFTINDKIKDNERLPQTIESNLLAVFKTLEITHLIIATEPKAHNMYIEFALKNNINVLTDKPITVTKNMTSIRSIEKVRKQYYHLYHLAENSKSQCYVMCQRQYHRGYEYIKNLLNDIVEKYQVPITYINIFHCDGNWEMPHDLLKENHPYKYGYGKLFHSGFHFIDLLSDFIKINNKLPNSKKIVNGEVYSNCFTPNDELGVFNIDDYNRIFKEQQIPEYYTNNKKKIKFNNFGEKNFYGLMEFTNKYHQVITNVSLDLLHYGFSRRGWIQSKDFYKKNGRIRHEYINIEVGTLLNIKVHSYQSKQIQDRKDCISEEETGGLEHFDIEIYRNVDIIGGKPFEKIRLGDLYSEKEKKDILGYNELSREVYLDKFLKGICDKGDIKEQVLGIELLYSCAMGIHNKYVNRKEPVKIDVRNSKAYNTRVKDLKKYSYLGNIKEEKSGIDGYNTFSDGYEFGVTFNRLKKNNNYELFIYVCDDKDVASMLLYKEIRSTLLAKIYFKILKFICKKHDIKLLEKILERK